MYGREASMKRLEVTEHSVCCPLEGRTANVAVRTNPDGHPSRRYLEVASCSLLPSALVVPCPRKVYFADVAPPMSYVREVDSTPRHSARPACPRSCLGVLNVAEAGAPDPRRCTASFGDSLDMARQTQSPGVMRLLWFNSV